MTVETLPVYCTIADVRRLFSTAGVLAFSDHNQDGLEDDDVVDDCIEQASDEVSMRLVQRYNHSDLDDVRLVTRWTTVLATCQLCRRRGNPVPESLALECERVTDLLDKIAAGKAQLPGVSLRTDMRPTWSNVKIDRRYPVSKTRVKRINSSDADTTLTQDEVQHGGFYDY